MDKFSIAQLSEFSGIKPHTIRIWEQRYNALEPNRSKGNTRYYDNNQLRRLLNIVSLSSTEHKVSDLCKMSDEKLQKLLLETKSSSFNNQDNKYYIVQLINAGIDYDENRFEKLFSHCLLLFGMKDMYLKIIYPVLERLGIMWSGNILPPAQEHFISNLLRKKLFTAIDSLPTPNKNESWLLFLPENEMHELGLLFANYMIQLSGGKVIYLGSNMPMESITKAIKFISPTNLLLFFVRNNSTFIMQNYIKELKDKFNGEKIYVIGHAETLKELSPGNQIHYMSSVDELESTIFNK